MIEKLLTRVNTISITPISSGIYPGTASDQNMPPDVIVNADARVILGVNGLEWEENETKTWTENSWQTTIEENRVSSDCTAKIIKQLHTLVRQSNRRCKYDVARTHSEKIWGGISGFLFGIGIFLVALGIITELGGMAASVAAGLGTAGLVSLGGGSFTFKKGLGSHRYKRGTQVSCTQWSLWIILSATPLGQPIVDTFKIPCDRPITQPSLWTPKHEDGYDGTPLANPKILDQPYIGEDNTLKLCQGKTKAILETSIDSAL